MTSLWSHAGLRARQTILLTPFHVLIGTRWLIYALRGSSRTRSLLSQLVAELSQRPNTQLGKAPLFRPFSKHAIYVEHRYP